MGAVLLSIMEYRDEISKIIDSRYHIAESWRKSVAEICKLYANEKAATGLSSVTASFISGPSWARSSDPLIMSQVHYSRVH